MKPEEFSKRMDEILERHIFENNGFFDEEIHREDAKLQLLRLFREVVPRRCQPFIGNSEVANSEMVGWNKCHDAITSSLPQESER